MSEDSSQAIGKQPVRRPGRVTGELVILLAAVVLLFTGLGTRSLWHSEGRWAEITREMFLSGDFFHPTIGGEPYFDKPLLTYWLVAAVAAATDRLDEWTARFPCALSGFVVILSTMWLGRRLWSASVGRLAGVVLLTSYGFLFWSRTAAADMENLAAIVLAVVWYWRHADRPGFKAFLGFHLIAFLGALTKGLPAVVVPVLAVLPDVVLRRRWRQVLTLGHAVALTIGLAVYLAPFWYASSTNPGSYDASGLALVFRENIVRFVQPFDHAGPVYLYLYYLPFLLLPWVPLFLGSIHGLVVLGGKWDQSTQWLVWAGAIIFAFFTASGSRRGYYILPVLPFCSLMIGVVFGQNHGDALAAVRRHGIRAQVILFAVFILLQFLGAPLSGPLCGRLGVTLPREFLYSMPVVAAAALLLGTGAYRLLAGRAEPHMRLLGAMGSTAVALMAGLFCWQIGVLEVFRTERPFVQRVAAATKEVPSTSLGVFRSNSAILLFYLDADGPVSMLRNANELRDFVSGDDPRIVLTPQRFLADARRSAPGRLPETPDMIQPSVPWAKAPPDDDWVAWQIPGEGGAEATVADLAEISNEK